MLWSHVTLSLFTPKPFPSSKNDQWVTTHLRPVIPSCSSSRNLIYCPGIDHDLVSERRKIRHCFRQRNLWSTKKDQYLELGQPWSFLHLQEFLCTKEWLNEALPFVFVLGDNDAQISTLTHHIPRIYRTVSSNMHPPSHLEAPMNAPSR